jgi:hypothetical protein
MPTTDFAGLIDARLAVLVQLLALARRQAAVIGENDLTMLLTVLAGKQQLVTELQALDRQLAPYQRQQPQSRQWPSAAERTRCQQQAARCEAVLREILLIEKQAEDQMTQQRDAVAQRLATFAQSAQAARAYIPSAPPPQTGMLDLTSEG